jgi:hypothetical protein
VKRSRSLLLSAAAVAAVAAGLTAFCLRPPAQAAPLTDVAASSWDLVGKFSANAKQLGRLVARVDSELSFGPQDLDPMMKGIELPEDEFFLTTFADGDLLFAAQGGFLVDERGNIVLALDQEALINEILFQIELIALFLGVEIVVDAIEFTTIRAGAKARTGRLGDSIRVKANIKFDALVVVDGIDVFIRNAKINFVGLGVPAG